MAESQGAMGAAIAGLYREFAAVPRPARVEACPCCLTAAELDALVAPVPLHELTADALRPYAASALHTAGGREDFRYYLPRILEIACTEGFAWPDLEVVAGRLGDAGWLTAWPPPERAAVRGVLWAMWRLVLATAPEARAPGLAADIDVDTALTAVARAESDLVPYLHHWTARLRGEGAACAAAHLRDLLTWHVRRTPGGWLPANAHWTAGRGRLSAWLHGRELRREIAAAFDATADPAHLELLADIDTLLRGD